MSDKTLRDAQTREKTVRPKVWAPADKLPEPTAQEGYGFRWIRKAMMGQPDPTNLSRNLREGWELCRIEDHPELALSVDTGTANTGIVEIGGLVLCKMPSELLRQREAYYSNVARSQVQSVDNSFMKENDPRMPLFSDKKSEVSFGKGRR